MEEKQKKVYLFLGVIAVLVLVAVAVAWILLKKPAVSPLEELPAEEQSTYGTLPENKSLTNPLQAAPELNPVDKTNPFKDAYKNPFE